MLETHLVSVHLRALEPEDLELLYTIENNEELWEVSNTCTPISKFALKQYLALQPQDVFQSGELRLVIEDVERNLAVGLVDLTSISIPDGRAEVGIALLKAEQGKGFGLAALRALDRYVKKNLRLRMLYAQISTQHNQKSVSVFVSDGYEKIAVLPAWHYYKGEYEDIAVFVKKM